MLGVVEGAGSGDGWRPGGASGGTGVGVRGQSVWGEGECVWN